MLIDNKLSRVVGIPVQKAPAVAGEQVPYLMLVPGISKVSEAEWSIAKDHEDAKQRMRKGTLAVVETGGKDNFTAIKDLDEVERLVSRVTDAALLEKMMKADSRDEFVAAAKKQIKKLELPAAQV